MMREPPRTSLLTPEQVEWFHTAVTRCSTFVSVHQETSGHAFEQRSYLERCARNACRLYGGAEDETILHTDPLVPNHYVGPRWHAYLLVANTINMT